MTHFHYFITFLYFYVMIQVMTSAAQAVGCARPGTVPGTDQAYMATRLITTGCELELNRRAASTAS